MPSWATFETLKNLSAVLGVIAAIIVSIGIIHKQVISPWIAKPIAQGVKNELADYMEIILFSEPMVSQLREIIQEEVVKGNGAIIQMLWDHDKRLGRMETKQNQIYRATTGKTT